MAIAVHSDPEVTVLARQAAMLDDRAERLRSEARSLADQAMDLRLEIGRRTRRPVEIYQPRVSPEKDTRLLAKIAETLERVGPCKSGVIAEHLNASQQRVLAALRHLEGEGAIKRSGIRRGTVWGLATDEDLTGHHEGATAYTLVRDAAIKLDTFDFPTISAELPMLGDGAIRRELPKLVAEGVLEEARNGRSKVWAYVKPTGPHTPRPKHAPPEAAVVRFAQRRGAAVAGTGRGERPTRKDVADLLEDCTRAGCEIEKASRHWRVLLGGQILTTVPGTPSDARSLKNARATIRRAGVDI